MSCLFLSPYGALEEVRLCVFNALSVPPFVVPGRVLIGPEGVGDGAPCCDDGVLILEWVDSFPNGDDPVRGGQISSVGGNPCRDRLYADLKVTVLRCVKTFELNSGGGTDGRFVSVVERNNAGLFLMQEAWHVLQALLCCFNSDGYRGCGFGFERQEFLRPEGGCWGYVLFLRSDIVSCCNV